MDPLIGAALISGAIGVGTSLGNMGLTTRARKENFDFNELAAENALGRQKELQNYLQKLQYRQYYDLESPAAIIKQLKEAGLSPSIYAQNAVDGNISGVSTPGAAPQGAGVSGPSAIAMSPLDLSGTYLQLAQADKAHEEAKALRGENKKGEAEIDNILADTSKKLAEVGLTEASESLAKANTLLTNIRTELESKNMEFNINKARAESEKACTLAQIAIYECISASSQAEVDSATIQERIEAEKLKNNLLKADELIRKSDVELNEARMTEISAEIEKWQAEIALQGGELATKMFEAQTRREFNKIMDDFYDEQVQNLKDRLQFDKDKFKKENVREWTRIIGTLVNDAQGNLLGLISKAIPFLAK